MEEENKVETETTENTEVETEATESSEEGVEELKIRLVKAEEVAKNQRIRAEKAESRAKEPKKEVKEDGLSQKDVIYLAKADIHEEDLDDVVEMAKLKKISVSEAHQYLKPILVDKAEKRRTAEVTNTGTGRANISKVTPEALLEKANKGEIPEDDDDIAKVVAAKNASYKSKR